MGTDELAEMDSYHRQSLIEDRHRFDNYEELQTRIIEGDTVKVTIIHNGIMSLIGEVVDVSEYGDVFHVEFPDGRAGDFHYTMLEKCDG